LKTAQNTRTKPHITTRPMSDKIESFERRIRQKNANSTAQRYAGAVRRFEGWIDEDVSFNEVDEYVVEDHLLELADDGYSKGTLTVALSGISRFYDEMREFDHNPTENVSIQDWQVVKKGSKKSQSLGGDDVHYLEPKEIQKLVDNVGKPLQRNKLIVRLLFQTGLRIGELRNIKLDHIDTDTRSIKIHAEKTHTNRTVYYQPSIDTMMRIWLEAERNAFPTADESDYLFPTIRSEQISKLSINRIIRGAAEEAGIQETLYNDPDGRKRVKITAHTLRHSFAVASLKNGMDIRTLQKLMGHAKIETTERYLDIADDDVKQRARQFGPSLKS